MTAMRERGKGESWQSWRRKKAEQMEGRARQTEPLLSCFICFYLL
jgi:hypothetical protein